MITKVTDPLKIVTDSVVIGELLRQDIDNDYVEFYQDYAKRGIGKSPYMKTYRDLITGNQLSVFSGLPMVDAYGLKYDLTWREKEGVFENGNNIFHCIVKNGTIRLILLSDQPNGIKKDAECSYHAQLFVNGSEVLPKSSNPIILETDPTNENYHYNVLEWDYGVCKRRVRIIEGRFKEWWVFPSNPNNNVRIKHNHTGSLPISLGFSQCAEGDPSKLGVVVVGDEEIIPASEFNGRLYPVEIGASLTVNPDTGTGSTTVDGDTRQLEAGGETWANMYGGTGNEHTDTANTIFSPVYIQSTTASKWLYLIRGLWTLDTSPLGASANISAATFSLMGTASKTDNLSASPKGNIYAAAPASDNDLVNGDFTTLSSTPFSDTDITYAAWVLDTFYNDFAFNATGIAAISKTGITKLGGRDVDYDVGQTEPNYVDSAASRMSSWGADKGVGKKPKLVITYTTGWANKFNGAANAAIGKINGVAIAGISKVNGV